MLEMEEIDWLQLGKKVENQTRVERFSDLLNDSIWQIYSYALIYFEET